MNLNIRQRLKKPINRFYERLNLNLDGPIVDLVESIEDLEIILCEHQLFFPHAGIYRLPLMAKEHYCDEKSVVLFIVNDIFYRRNHYTTRHLGIYCKGQSFTDQKKPVVINCDKLKALNSASIPNDLVLDNLLQKIIAKYNITYSWLKKRNIVINKEHRNYIENKVIEYINLFKESANDTSNYSDWCALINYQLYKITNPREIRKILFVFHSDLLTEFGDVIDMFEKDSTEFSKIITDVFVNESENVLKSNKTSENSVYPFWYICDGCGYRNRGKTVNSEVEFLCDKCHLHFKNVNSSNTYRYLDVVGKQTLSSFLMPKLRVVGSIKPYSAVADRCASSIYNIQPPIRVVLPSRVIGHSLTTPDAGASDLSVLSMLLESDANNYGSSIVSDDWDKDIKFFSDMRLLYL